MFEVISLFAFLEVQFFVAIISKEVLEKATQSGKCLDRLKGKGKNLQLTDYEDQIKDYIKKES